MWPQILSLAFMARSTRNARKAGNDLTPPKPRCYQPLAILPFLVMVVALILSMLCVYAGHKPGFMEDYNVFTLNVSRLGENLRSDLDTKIESVHFKRSVPLTLVPTMTAVPTTMITVAPRNIISDISHLGSEATSKAHSAGSAIESHVTSAESAVGSAATSALGAVQTDVVNAVNKAFNGLISDLHLKDFYSIHIATTCEGAFVFKNGTNITVGESELPTKRTHKHVNTCQKHSALDPFTLIPIVYWIGIVFTAIALALGFLGIFITSEKFALLNVLATAPAFCFIGLASAATHGISLGATKLINFIGADIGIQGVMGKKFLTLTYAVVVLVIINMALWTLLFVLRGRSAKQAPSGRGLGWSLRSNRPDRTSGIAMESISRPQRIFDRNGNEMI